MLTHPGWDPVALRLGPLQIHWYALMYLAGFAAFYWLGSRRGRQRGDWTAEQVMDLLYYAAFGVILGGRIGYMLFYDFQRLLAEPLSLFKLWQGGMSFHGGLLGVLLALWLYTRRTQRPFWSVMDFVAPMVPIGLGLGRIGNFINGELPGRVTDVPWAMVFPAHDLLPRHPSQLYQALAEGVLLFALLWWFSRKPRPAGTVSGLFGVGYGLTRFITEFFRQPDPQLGFVLFGWMSMGQLLSLPMMVVGAGMMYWFSREKPHAKLP